MGDKKQTRLTEDQKRANHIDSEKKRRDAIREGFDRLAEIIPGCAGQGRSEAVVLQSTVQYLMEQQIIRKNIKKAALAQGWSERDIEDVYRKEGEKTRAAAQGQAGSGSDSNSSTGGGNGETSRNGRAAHSHGAGNEAAIKRDDSNGPTGYDGSGEYPAPPPNTNHYSYNPGQFGSN